MVMVGVDRNGVCECGYYWTHSCCDCIYDMPFVEGKDDPEEPACFVCEGCRCFCIVAKECRFVKKVEM